MATLHRQIVLAAGPGTLRSFGGGGGGLDAGRVEVRAGGVGARGDGSAPVW
jgi:hypothetical protein